MDGRIRVLEIANNWGIGGAEMAYQVRISQMDRTLFASTAVGFESGGPRLDILAGLGIPTAVCHLSYESLERLFTEVRPHLVHWLRVTTVNALIAEGRKLAGRYGVAGEIETNVFGRPALDAGLTPAGLIAHVSQTSMLRCAGLAHTTMDGLADAHHRTIYNPVPTAEFARHALSSAEREAVRTELGVSAQQQLAIRVGRADMRKWSLRLELAIPRMLAAVPNLVFAFRSAPAERFKKLQRKCGDRVRLLPETSDVGELCRFYQASDLMIHSSAIGESFGCTLAEAMYWRKPVVVDSTPDMDNAQIEVVDHGETGLVVRSVAGFVEAARRLATDPELRARLGEAGHAKVLRSYAEGVVTRVWEKRYIELLDRVGSPIIGERHRAYAAAVPELPGVDERNFPAEYAARLGRYEGPLPGAWERGQLCFRHAASTLAFARRIGVRRVYWAIRDRLRAGRLFRRA